jgi:hypothetical protein
MALQTNATRAGEGLPSSSPLPIADRLRSLEPLLGQLGREDLYAALAPVIGALGADRAPSVAREEIESAIGFCRRLFAAARSPDALALAHAAHDLACRAGDPALQFRTSAACGIVHGDAGDFVTAIEYHLEALRAAAGPR